MKLRIVNHDGVGLHTEIYLQDGNNEIGPLRCVERIIFNEINTHDLICAQLVFSRVDIDLICKPIKPTTLYVLHAIHNKKEIKRLGLRRIN